MDLKTTKTTPAGVRTVRHSRVRQLEDGWWILMYDESKQMIADDCRGPFATKDLAEHAQCSPIAESVKTATRVETTAAGREILAKGRRRSRRSTPY